MMTIDSELPEPRRSCATALARVLGGALIAVSLAAIAATPAMADDDWEGGEGEGRWHRHKHRKHHGYDYYYSEGYYYQPPAYYYQPAPVYVAPPPPPVYYYPAPVYPQFNIVVPLDFD